MERCTACNIKCNKIRITPDVLRALEDGYKRLKESDSSSLLKKYLTQEIFDKLKNNKTSFGSSLLDCVISGFENLDSGCGIYAPDAEAYTVFAPIFDPIIQDYHMGFRPDDKHPKSNWGDVNSFDDLDPAGHYIVSTRVRCGRSIVGYPFNPCMTENHYQEIESKMSAILTSLTGELKGEYKPLVNMSKEEQQKLIDSHYLFKEGDRFLQSAKACRFWPVGRGIFLNHKNTFLVWVNEEDHLRIISMQNGGDLGAVYKRLISGVEKIEKSGDVKFSRSPRLGYLTFCPTNLGTTIRASVHIKLPKLSLQKTVLNQLAENFHLQIRGTRGEHTDSEGGILDISNKRRLGLTEYDALKEMYDGITEIIRHEERTES